MSSTPNVPDGFRALAPVSPAAADLYEQHMPALIEAVDQALLAHPDLSDLVGGAPHRVMTGNHRNHAAFMLTLFRLNHFPLLLRTVPWVYRTYRKSGFSYDYFPVELDAWHEAVARFLEDDAHEILAVYTWMRESHEAMIALAEDAPSSASAVPAEWKQAQVRFLEALLQGKQRLAVGIAESSVTRKELASPFYLHVIQPSLYEIGSRWERGEVSVAQEHLASAICARVISAVYLGLDDLSIGLDRAVVATAPGERHELGAWMISDALEAEGWDVSYIGADTPPEDLIELLRERRPAVLMLSITMPFFIHQATSLIRRIKGDPLLRKVHVVVGGQIFNSNPGLWEVTGADATASTLIEAVAVCEPHKRENRS